MDQTRLCRPEDLRRLCKIAVENDLPMRVTPERLAVLRDDTTVVLLPYPRTEQAYVRSLCLFGTAIPQTASEQDLLDVLLEDFLDLPTVMDLQDRNHPFYEHGPLA